MTLRVESQVGVIAVTVGPHLILRAVNENMRAVQSSYLFLLAKVVKMIYLGFLSSASSNEKAIDTWFASSRIDRVNPIMLVLTIKLSEDSLRLGNKLMRINL